MKFTLPSLTFAAVRPSAPPRPTPFRLRWLAAPAALALASCAIQPVGSGLSIDQARATVPPSSPECLTSKIKPVDPFPASAIPPGLLAQAKSGLVALRYDVIGGVPKNVDVVRSSPEGLYDAAARQHLSGYRDPAGGTARGCVMTVDIKF